MKISKKELNRIVSWLDEKYLTIDINQACEVEYLTGLKVVELLGFYWERMKENILFINKQKNIIIGVDIG